MTPQRCDCCDLLLDSCGKAAQQRQQAQHRRELAALRARLYATPGWFPARWPGVCCHCGDDFPPDTLIRADDVGRRHWVAECCAHHYVPGLK